MTKQTNDQVIADLISIRRNLIEYCEGLPDLVSHHGPDACGSLALSVGKCLKWIGPSIDQYAFGQTLPIKVAEIGERLRVAGVRLMQNPTTDFDATIASLNRQVSLLKRIAKMRKGGEK